MYQKTKSLTVGGIETVPRDQDFPPSGSILYILFPRFKSSMEHLFPKVVNELNLVGYCRIHPYLQSQTIITTHLVGHSFDVMKQYYPYI